MSKRLKHDPAKEEAILDAAIVNFAKDGYHASTQQIALAAGVSKGSVFRYFKNKSLLFEAAVKKAMATLNAIVDLDVWRNATDLVNMVVRATSYKTELSHQYPNEFALLLRVYLKEPGIPVALRTTIYQGFQSWSTQISNEVIRSFVDKLTLRSDIDPDVIKHYLFLTVQALMIDVQKYLEQHPQLKKIEEMDEIVKKVEQTMDLIEHGIVAK